MNFSKLFDDENLPFMKFTLNNSSIDIEKICSDTTNVNSEEMVMGGRRRLSNHSTEFYDRQSMSVEMRSLYNHLNQKHVVDLILQQLLTSFPYSTEARRVGIILRTGLWDEFGAFNQNKFYSRIRRLLFKTPFGVFIRPKYFLHFDYSSAGNGYWREPHLDGENRMAAGLIYFGFTRSPNSKGGEFSVYRSRLNGNIRQPKLETLDLVQLIEPEAGLGLCFLNDSNAYHGVELMDGFGVNDIRYFCYFGVSTDGPKHDR